MSGGEKAPDLIQEKKVKKKGGEDKTKEREGQEEVHEPNN